MGTDKVFWIGDDGDNKSVLINRKVYARGEEIPAEDVPDDLLKEWQGQGLVSVGKNIAPIVVKDTESSKKYEAEIRSLKSDLDRLPGLEREIADLKKALKSSKSGKKADAVKALEADVEAKDKEINDLGAKVTELDLDVQEKVALIDKLNADIEALTNPDGKPESKDDLGGDDSGGPG